ncbi:hypothetical protein CKAH01_17527 [Colletotrichum kahawae]|uniref:Uncharacterized protein n=1 Tax=Colletotrichum kahawae TaxID=34407 RepID=A0AAE0D488_COLKA|nr:hypothetical protein CKAH01_17527 [Colletotrichum kahawae]
MPMGSGRCLAAIVYRQHAAGPMQVHTLCRGCFSCCAVLALRQSAKPVSFQILQDSGYGRCFIYDGEPKPLGWCWGLGNVERWLVSALLVYSFESGF